MPFQRWRKWHISMASNRKRSRRWSLANNMGQGEGPTVPLQSDALEESDLWTAWQLFPLDDDQTCHSKDIEWAIELLYNSVKTGSQLVWRPDQLVTRCGGESPHPAEWAPRRASGERKRHDTDGHKSGGQYIAVLFGLQLLLTHKPFK